MKLDAAEGAHYGWIRFQRPDLAPGRPYQLTDYAVNPLPEAPILAGVYPPGPPLEVAFVAEPGSDPRLQIGWPVQLGSSAFTLEWSPSLTEPDWKPMEGVVNQHVTLQVGVGDAFFRLVRTNPQ